MSALTDEEGDHVIGSCPSKRTSLGQMINVFMTYVNAHRDELDERAAVVVMKSFHEAFPCKLAGP